MVGSQANIILDNNGTPRAGFAYFAIDDYRGLRYVSLPYSDYTDPIVNSVEDWDLLIDNLIETNRPIKLRCLRTDIPLLDSRFVLTNEAKWHQVDIRRHDIDEMWSNIHPSARRAVNKARRSDVHVEFRNDKDALRAFFEMHLDVRKNKYNLLPQPYSFFEEIWEQFLKPGHGVLAMAIHEDKFIGATLNLFWKDTFYYKFSASSLDDLAVRPTDLIIWESICYAKRQNLSFVDFGVSDIDQEGLVRFKNKYATSEETISFLERGTGELDPSSQQIQAVFDELTGLLTDESVPADIIAKAGDLLYRFFV